MVVLTKTRITAGEYHQAQAYAEESLIQLIDGAIVIAMPPTPPHQAVVLLAAILLKAIAVLQGGKVYISPIEVYLDEYNSPEPDVVYLAAESRCQVRDKLLVGSPELILEVLPPAPPNETAKTSSSCIKHAGSVNTGLPTRSTAIWKSGCSGMGLTSN